MANMESENVISTAVNWISQGKKVALATVVGTWGSSPRPAGSHLIVDSESNFVGSVSGGCIEGAVITEALETISDGQVRVLEFGVTNEQAWDVGLACGGNIRLFVESITDPKELELIADTRPLTVVTELSSGKKRLLNANDSLTDDLQFSDALDKGIQEVVRNDVSRLISVEGNEYFVELLNLPLRMIIVGAVHISQALVGIAKSAGFEVSVIDPRGSFATKTRFPDVTLIDEWPDDAVKTLKPDDRTALVTLTHDPKLDDPALEAALVSDCFYIGSLGSKKTHSARVERLLSNGFTDKQINRINAPIGLDIGAKSPSEIAVSILAEVISAKYNKVL